MEKCLTKEPTMEKRLKQLALQSALMYAFFLLPTVILLYCGGFSDSHISQLIVGTWQAKFWAIPLLGRSASRVIFDLLSLLAIGGVTWKFWQGFCLLRSVETCPRSSEITQATQEPVEQEASPPASLAGETGSAVPPKNAQSLWRAVLLWTAFCGLLLLAVVPFHSSDFYGYLNRGFQQSAFHTNPYLTTVSTIPNWEQSPLLHAHWIDNPCPYGFFFAALANWLTALTGPCFTSAFLLFKLLNLMALLATTVLIHRIALQFNHPRPWLPAYLFGANPLVLLHVMGNGHNDILMVLFMMASLWCLMDRKWLWFCLPLLTLSVLIKYSSLLALPLMVFCLFSCTASLLPVCHSTEGKRTLERGASRLRVTEVMDGFVQLGARTLERGTSRLLHLLGSRRWEALVLGGMLSAGLLVLFGGFYIDPGHAWPWTAMLDNAGKAQHSLISALGRSIYYISDIFSSSNTSRKWMALVTGIAKPMLWGGFVIFYLAQLYRFSRAPHGFTRLLTAAGLTMMVMVAFVSAKFHPWYTLMFLPLLLLLPETSRLYRFGILFAMFQILGFTLLLNVHIINVLLLNVLPAWLAWKDLPLPGFPSVSAQKKSE